MGSITRTIANNLTNDLGGAGGINFRNIIINGDMSIAQRGTSTSGITGSGYNTVDRFSTNILNMGTFTESQSTDVPTGQGFATSLKLDCTTADASPAAGDNIQFRQKVEAQNLQYLKFGTSSAESITLSFWVKSVKTGTYIVELRHHDATKFISQSYTISSASTWEKKTLTFPGYTTTGFGNDNDAGLFINWWLGAGTNFTSGTLNTSWNSLVDANSAVGQVNLADDTANEWYITGVQLEAGTSASDFEFLPVDVNLQRCYRYFQHHLKRPNEAYTGGFRSATSVQVGIQMFAEMRGNPSATYQGIRVHDLADGNNLDASAISFGAIGGDYRTAVWTIITCGSGGTSGDVAIVHGQDTESSGILGFYMDAEL
jgi:hypothetical protein